MLRHGDYPSHLCSDFNFHHSATSKMHRPDSDVPRQLLEMQEHDPISQDPRTWPASGPRFALASANP
jgi:hypothetical protein